MASASTALSMAPRCSTFGQLHFIVYPTVSCLNIGFLGLFLHKGASLPLVHLQSGPPFFSLLGSSVCPILSSGLYLQIGETVFGALNSGIQVEGLHERRRRRTGRRIEREEEEGKKEGDQGLNFLLSISNLPTSPLMIHLSLNNYQCVKQLNITFQKHQDVLFQLITILPIYKQNIFIYRVSPYQAVNCFLFFCTCQELRSLCRCHL